MKKCLFTVAALLLVITCVKAQQRKNAADPDRNNFSDKGFIQQAIEAGIAEVNLGRLGQSKGTNPMVKELGAMMVREHQKANEELIQLATRKGYTNVLDRANADAQNDYEQLMKKEGADFNKAFAGQMVKDHEKTIKLFKKQAEGGEDEELRNWAAQTLPTLEQHLDHARKLKDTLGNNK